MIVAKRMILIGSSGRNSGKTTLAVELIRRLQTQFPLVGLKITSIEKQDALCPRGGSGCGACSLNTPFVICEECQAEGGKDTAQLLAAGADKVFWLRSLRAALPDGFGEFNRKLESASASPQAVPQALSALPFVREGRFEKEGGGVGSASGTMPLVICESNSLRHVVHPALFIMLNNASGEVKESAKSVAHYADITIQAPFKESDIEAVLGALRL
jgi:hypothetical protein